MLAQQDGEAGHALGPQDVRAQLAGLLAGERDLVANAANFSALLAGWLDDINWLGFYFLRGGELVLGPFQGRPACVRIPLGQGVCGTAAAERRTVAVPDVHDFPGHITCDVRSRSELVVPLLDGPRVVGVLDIDSPTRERFPGPEVHWVEALVEDFCRLQFGS
jgi:GAF domain-containing protein